MNEAEKLAAGPDEVLPAPDVYATQVADLPPLSRKNSQADSWSPSFFSRLFQVTLILFLVSLLAFAAGVTVASAMMSGELDKHAAWAKEVIHHVKDAWHTSR